jgi:hypothetical protein
MGMIRNSFVGTNSRQFLGLVMATAALLLAGCQESPSANGTAGGSTPATSGQAVSQTSPAGSGTPNDQTNEPQTADDVLKKMFEAYRECRSYRDTGVMVSAIQGPLASGEKTENSTTVFARPARYRFTKTWSNDDGDQEQLIWRNDAEFQIHWNTRPNLKPAQSLDEAFGLGHPQAELIASMLMSDVHHSPALDTVGHVLAGEETLDGHACWLIKALTTKQQSAQFWIDKQSFLLRQFKFKRQAGAISEERVLTWQPEVNVDIPNSALQLDPPAVK